MTGQPSAGMRFVLALPRCGLFRCDGRVETFGLGYEEHVSYPQSTTCPACAYDPADDPAWVDASGARKPLPNPFADPCPRCAHPALTFAGPDAPPLDAPRGLGPVVLERVKTFAPASIEFSSPRLVLPDPPDPADLDPELVFVDLETMGFSADRDPIVEVAAVRTTPDGAKVLESWTTLVVPDHYNYDRHAIATHGLDPMTPEFVAAAQPLPQAMDHLHGFLTRRRCAVAGHNVQFDCRFLEVAFARCGLPVLDLRVGRVDTAAMARELAKRGEKLPKSTKLEALAAHFKVVGKGRAHRAAADVGTTVRVYRALRALREDLARRTAAAPPAPKRATKKTPGPLPGQKGLAF